MKKLIFGIVFFMVALTLVAMPTLAKSDKTNGPANKATGTVGWAARNGGLPGLITSFNAHDLGDGMVDKGNLTTYRPTDPTFNEGTITIDIKCVNVKGNEAWFAGEAVEGTGGYAGNIGDAYLYWVEDVSTPGSEGDRIGGMPYSSLGAACSAATAATWHGSGAVDNGNLVVHNYETED